MLCCLLFLANWLYGQSTPKLKIDQGHMRDVTCVAISPDSRFALTAAADGAVLWDVASGHEIRRFSTRLEEKKPIEQEWVNSVAFSPDGTQVVTGGGGSLR